MQPTYHRNGPGDQPEILSLGASGHRQRFVRGPILHASVLSVNMHVYKTPRFREQATVSNGHIYTHTVIQHNSLAARVVGNKRRSSIASRRCSTSPCSPMSSSVKSCTSLSGILTSHTCIQHANVRSTVRSALMCAGLLLLLAISLVTLPAKFRAPKYINTMVHRHGAAGAQTRRVATRGRGRRPALLSSSLQFIRFGTRAALPLSTLEVLLAV